MPVRPEKDKPEITMLDKLSKGLLYGSMPKEIECNTQFNELTLVIKGKITKEINLIAEKHDAFKIGITGNIENHMHQQDYRECYYNYSILYTSEDEDKTIDFEVKLIEKNMNNHPKKCQNLEAKEATNVISYDGYFHIYIVY